MTEIDRLSITCGGVVCDERQLSEIDSGRVMVMVDRDDIQRIRLRDGLIAPHPVLQGLIGSALLIVGYFPIAHLVRWYREGGVFFEGEAFIAPFVAIGGWMVFTAFRHGTFLEVDSKKGRKRFDLRRADPAEIDHFAARVEEAYGIPVERQL